METDSGWKPAKHEFQSALIPTLYSLPIVYPYEWVSHYTKLFGTDVPFKNSEKRYCNKGTGLCYYKGTLVRLGFSSLHDRYARMSPIKNPSTTKKIDSVHNVKNKGKFIVICMGSSEHNWANISETISSKC